MLFNLAVNDVILNDENCYTIKRVFDEDTNKLSLVQVLNSKGWIYKVLFYDESGKPFRMSIYNPETGREIRSITYKSDGKTISSTREYDLETERLLSITFYKSDGIGVSSIIEYDETGTKVQFTLYGDNGETTVHNI